MLLTGADGRLGRALCRCPPPDVALTALPRGELDIVDGAQVARALRELRPAVVVNAAAFSDVDGAERAAAARAVNCDGPRLLAQCAARESARLIHLSTDYVFDGDFGGGLARPYAPQDTPRPLSAYGRGKLAGERAALAAHPHGTLVLRSAWLYDAHSPNFVTGLLARMAADEPVAVAVDQVGSPTWLPNLAAAIWAAVRRPTLRGVLHCCDGGAVTRHAWAVALSDRGAALGVLPARVPVRSARMADFPASALRPRYSALDSSAAARLLPQPTMPWRTALERMLLDYRAQRCGTDLSR